MKHMSKDEIMKTRPAKKVWARDKNIQLAKMKRGIRNNRSKSREERPKK